LESIFKLKKLDTVNWLEILDITFWTEACATKITYKDWDKVDQTSRLFFLKKVWRDSKEYEDQYRAELEALENEIKNINMQIKMEKNWEKPNVVNKIESRETIWSDIWDVALAIKYKIEWLLIDLWLVVSENIKFLSEPINHSISKILKQQWNQH
jgi:hypothetical protein